MRFYYTLIFAILFFSLGNSQRKSDTLQTQINLLKPVVDLISYNNSQKISNAIFNDDSKISNYFETLEKGLEYYLNALVWVEKNGTETQIIAAKRAVLDFYACLLYDDKIIETSRDLLQYSEVQESQVAVKILYLLKEAYRRNEQFDDLIGILPLYHQYSKKYGYFAKGEESVAIDIAYVHYSLKNYEKAIKAYKEIAQEMEDKKAYFQKSSTLNNIGLCFYNAKKNDSAIYYFDKAIRLILNKVTTIEIRNGYAEHFMNVINSNKAEILLNKGELDVSLPYFEKELASGKRFNELNIVASSYYNIGKIAYLKNNPKIAIEYIDSALVVLKSYHDVKVEKMALRLKARSYLHLNNYKKANFQFEIHQKYIDSLDAINTHKNYMIDVVKHETNEKIIALSVSKEKLILKEKESFYLQLFMGFFALLAIGLLFIYSSMKKGHAIIAAQKNNVDRALEEKEILLKEIHHRIKNNLQVVSSLLQVHASKIKNKDFEELLDQSQRQIFSMSLVHEMLYQKGNVSIISMQNYLTELSRHLLSTFSGESIYSEIDAGDISLSIDFANPIGLIVSELILNSVKHAFVDNKGTIKMRLSKKDDVYTFLFKDDGKGIVANKEIDSNAQFGKRLISLLAEEMNAELQEYNDNGLTYVFVFKYKEKN